MENFIDKHFYVIKLINVQSNYVNQLMLLNCCSNFRQNIAYNSKINFTSNFSISLPVWRGVSTWTLK